MKYLERIRAAFGKAIGPSAAAAIAPDATMETVPGWNSENFIDLVLAVEDEFQIAMSTLDATALTSVQAIELYLEKQLG